MGSKSKEEFREKLVSLESMTKEELKAELAETMKSLAQYNWAARHGAKCQTPGLIHHLRKYKKAIVTMLLSRG